MQIKQVRENELKLPESNPFIRSRESKALFPE
jgi:hypothetical protein